MDPKFKKLVEDTRDYLLEVCISGWDRYTDRYIVPMGEYTREQEMQIGDSTAWRLYNEITKILEEGKPLAPEEE